jgi:hypothetical protein
MTLPEEIIEGMHKASMEYSVNCSKYRSSMVCLEKAFMAGAEQGYELGVKAATSPKIFTKSRTYQVKCHHCKGELVFAFPAPIQDPKGGG